MTGYAVPAYVEQNRQTRALAAHRPHPCMLCTTWTHTTLWPAGWHCHPCARSRGLHVGPAPGAYPEHLRNRRHPLTPQETAA